MSTTSRKPSEPGRSSPLPAAPPQSPAALAATPARARPFSQMVPFVHDDGEGKSLHFTIYELQSRMKKQNPWSLDVDYTRTMMGFLLLKPRPVDIAMIGLGGGSLAKFCYRHLPGCRMTVVDINPHVIALRREFCVPDDDERFCVLQADGSVFVAGQNARFDVLLIDGFDHQGQPAELCSQRFYDNCLTALRPDGVMAVNLHYDDADYPLWMARLQRSFDGNVVEIPAPEKSNSIALASRGAALSPRHLSLQAALAGLADAQARTQLKPEFARILWTMKDLQD